MSSVKQKEYHMLALCLSDEGSGNAAGFALSLIEDPCDLLYREKARKYLMV